MADVSKILEKRVVKGSDALRCCEINGITTLGRVQSLLNDILAGIQNPPRGSALALVPGVGVPGLLRAIQVGEAVATGAAGAALGVVVILLPAVELYALSQTKGAYETLSLVGNAVGALQRAARDSTDCPKCLEDRVLSQAKHRHRMLDKLLRRV